MVKRIEAWHAWTMGLFLTGISAALPASPGSRAAARPDAASLSSALTALAGDVYANGRSFDYLSVLSDRLGPRLSGSADYDRAARWAVEQFHAMGISDVQLQPFTLASGWQRGAASARLFGDAPRELHVLSYGWSPATPAGGARGSVTVLEETTDAAIAQAQVRGRFVLIDRRVFTGPAVFRRASVEEWDRSRRYETLHHRLAQAGALGMLVYTERVNQVMRTSDPVGGGVLMELPVASIGREDALLLRRLLDKGSVEISLSLDNRVSGPVALNSVIAQIPGREFADEVVMMGAHLDSWDLATGAQDNGSGVAQVMDVARAFAARGQAPRRTLRFALWASEEQGLNGSTQYVRLQGGKMRQIVAYLNTDTGAGRPKGWKVAGGNDLAKVLKPWSAMLARIGGNSIDEEVEFDTDSGPFAVAGVPALNLDVVDDEYDAVVHHKPADTLDKVDEHDLAAGAAMLAVTAMVLAEAPQRPLQRMDWKEVQQILERNGAKDYVMSSAFKDLWRD